MAYVRRAFLGKGEIDLRRDFVFHLCVRNALRFSWMCRKRSFVIFIFQKFNFSLYDWNHIGVVAYLYFNAI